MVLLIDILSWAMIVAGGLLSIIGGIGMIRMPDLFTRMHAASLTDTLGAMLMLGGLIVQSLNQVDWPSIIRLVLILAFLLLTSPVSTHALAGAALRAGVKPANCDDRTGGTAGRGEAGRSEGGTSVEEDSA